MDQAFEQPARSVTNIADAPGVMSGTEGNIDELVAQDAAQAVDGRYPKLIGFSGFLTALRVG